MASSMRVAALSRRQGLRMSMSYSRRGSSSFPVSRTDSIWRQSRSMRQERTRFSSFTARLGSSAVRTMAPYAVDALSFYAVPPRISRACYETEKDESACRILAVSTSKSLQQHEQRFLRRLLQWLRGLVRSMYETTTVALRSAEVALRFAPLALLTPAAVLTSKVLPNDAENKLSELAWWYTIHSLQALGPCFVKLAQWVATRRDMFPPMLCDRFARLHDRGYAHPWQYTQKALTHAFGDYEENGLHVESINVIGCGSAAQVYRASLDTTDANGVKGRRTVAVKVLHPRFQTLVERDLSFMKAVADILNALPSQTVKMLNLPRVADNFGNILRRQADLRVEGKNLVQFRKNFRDTELDSSDVKNPIFFPLPVEGWMTEDVLVEDLVSDAKPISDYLRDSTKEGWAIRRELAGPLLRAFLKMIFMDNFVHADLHPGNILIHTAQVATPSGWWSNETEVRTKRTIVILDAGIATSLDPVERLNLRDLFRAVILNDGNTAGRLMVERAKYERCSEVEGGTEAFAQGVEDIVAEFHDRRKAGLTLGAVRIGSLLSQVLDLCREHGVEVDPAMASIIVSTLVLEGLGRSLEPDLNLIDCAVPFVLGRGHV